MHSVSGAHARQAVRQSDVKGPAVARLSLNAFDSDDVVQV
jgi:hypothetical protein